MTFTSNQIAHILGNRPFRYFEQIGSTNDEALSWAQSGAPAGAVVIADEQTRGRGRQGRTWVSPPGTSLMQSIVLRPEPDQLSRLTMLGAVAVSATLDRLGVPDVTIKWPNDIRVRGLKICGVLPEAAWDNDRLTGVVIGIGLNVSVDFAGTSLYDTATSIQAALGRPVDRLDVLPHLLDAVDAWAARLDSAELFETWRARLDTIGRSVRIASDQVVEGIAESVDDQGALVVRESDGALRRVVAGDITFERER
jgi:BirA family biotin operon repressor/biotin-[acetyl-CoA-carboxylase] ligase